MARVGVVYTSDFETGAIQSALSNPDGWSTQHLAGFPDEANSVVTTRSRSGSYCYRSYYDQSWGLDTGGNYRSQISSPGGRQVALGTEEWFGFSVYLEDNANNQALIQDSAALTTLVSFNEISPGTQASYVSMRSGRWIGQFGSYSSGDWGAIELGRWNDFMFHYRVANDDTGFCEVWLNAASGDDTRVYNRLGANATAPIYFKAGIYRKTFPAGSTYAEQFYDSFRIGDSSSNFESVYPGDIADPPPIGGVVTEIGSMLRDGQIGAVVNFDASTSSTDKKVWINQNDGPMVEQAVTAETDTSVTFNVSYQNILQNGTGTLYVGIPQPQVVEPPPDLNPLTFEYLMEGATTGLVPSGPNPLVVYSGDSRQGSQCMQCRLTRDLANTLRVEGTQPGNVSIMDMDTDYWIGGSLKLVGPWQVEPQSAFEICFQIHNAAPTGQPPVAFYMGAGYWRLRTGSQIVDRYDIQQDVDRWLDYVIYYRPSATNQGRCTIWFDGVQMTDFTGVTAQLYNGDGPYLKWGIYKGILEGVVEVREVRHDSIRIIKGPSGKYEDVDPRSYD